MLSFDGLGLAVPVRQLLVASCYPVWFRTVYTIMAVYSSTRSAISWMKRKGVNGWCINFVPQCSGL